MPCGATGFEECVEQLTPVELRVELDRVTNILCRLTNLHSQFIARMMEDKELIEWMQQHKVIDMSRNKANPDNNRGVND